MRPVSSEKSILIVEDEHSIRYALRRFLAGRGWCVREAATVREAHTALDECAPDVVLLDIRLPDGDGLDVLQRVGREAPAAKTIMMTAYGTLDTVTRSLELGAFDYLVKPLDLARAAELSERALQRTAAGDPPSPAAGDGESAAAPGEPAPAVGERSNAIREQSSAAPERSAPVRPAPADPAGVVLVGASAVMQEVYKRIALVARSDASVLVLGQTGTGKDLVARGIHVHGPRRQGPFVPVNCGAIPPHLVESELFGHVRGAFTGAVTDRPGRFEAAHNGTLFLDEVGELPPDAQVKLLRVLDTQTVERVGSMQPIRLDVRVLAATNRDLENDVRRGRFREDLYYRLAVLRIELPALRDRREDILDLAKFFLASIAARGGAHPPALTPDAAIALQRHPWGGNVRELRNAMEHAAVVSAGGPILREHLPESVLRGAQAGGAQGESDRGGESGGCREVPARGESAGGPAAGSPAETAAERYLDALGECESDWLPTAIAPLERVAIRRALQRAHGHHGEAARLLGIHRNTLRAKLRELGLEQ